MQLRFGNCLLDLGTRELFRNEQLMPLSPKAFQLLELLVGSRPNAVSKEKVHEVVWPGSFVVDGNLANLVSELREAMDDDARRPSVIRTVPRFGYAFVAAVDAGRSARVAEEDRTICRLLWGEREIALRPGENLIGRDQKSVVWIDDFDVSRRHARIVVEDGRAEIEDLGSKNGTFVAGRRIESRTTLADGDIVSVGAASMVFRAFSRTGPTATASERRPGA